MFEATSSTALVVGPAVSMIGLAVAADLEPAWWQRGFQRLATLPPISWTLPVVLPRVDRFLLDLTDGSVSIPQVFTGLPVILLTTTGAKTCTERTTPVMGIPHEDGWVLIASNWGNDHHPAWYHNLVEHPRVTVVAEDRREYVATTVTGEKREVYWEMAANIYVGFEAYARRSGDREIPVVELRPVADSSAGPEEASGSA